MDHKVIRADFLQLGVVANRSLTHRGIVYCDALLSKESVHCPGETIVPLPAVTDSVSVRDGSGPKLLLALVIREASPKMGGAHNLSLAHFPSFDVR